MNVQSHAPTSNPFLFKKTQYSFRIESSRLRLSRSIAPYGFKVKNTRSASRSFSCRSSSSLSERITFIVEIGTDILYISIPHAAFRQLKKPILSVFYRFYRFLIDIKNYRVLIREKFTREVSRILLRCNIYFTLILHDVFMRLKYILAIKPLNCAQRCRKRDEAACTTLKKAFGKFSHF